MFHIVFESRGVELLAAAMDLDEALDGETVLIRDDYSVGPLQDLSSEGGRENRENWWSSCVLDGEKMSFSGNQESDAATLGNVLHRMREEEFDQVWIWLAPNAKDICGYYWLISQLVEFSGRIFVIQLNNLPFISEKGTVFYPLSLSEIPAREFTKAKKLVRPVTPAEFETDSEEWLRITSENKNLRLLENGKKIIQQGDEYFDKSLTGALQPVFQKIPRAVHQFLLKSPEKINESFLLWRLKQLVHSGVAEQQGETIKLFAKTANEVNE